MLPLPLETLAVIVYTFGVDVALIVWFALDVGEGVASDGSLVDAVNEHTRYLVAIIRRDGDGLVEAAQERRDAGRRNAAVRVGAGGYGVGRVRREGRRNRVVRLDVGEDVGRDCSC